VNHRSRPLPTATPAWPDPMDPRMLTRARDAVARLRAVRQRAEAAQAECAEHIRALYAAGANVHTIADALDLDPALVAHIVSAPAEPRRVQRAALCDLCGTPVAEPERLIAGPGGHICTPCIDRASTLVIAGRSAARSDGDLSFIPFGSVASCSFCGKPASAAAALLIGRERDTRICDRCVATCVDIARRTGHRRQ
jgi:ClpX C4-type zinc finger